MINHELGIIFVHIQKTGGNAITAAFGANPHRSEKHLAAKDLRKLYGAEVWDSYFKFAFVRNPWDRLVSWWAMINGHRNNGTDIKTLNRFQRYILDNSTTFEEFILNCSEEIEDEGVKKWIYRNQIDYIVDDDKKLMVDFIGRYENIEDDFRNTMQRALGKPISLPRTNQSNHDHYSKYYTPALAERVRTFYSRDIEAFSYTF